MANKMTFKLSKEYSFDEKKISEIDLTKLNDAAVGVYLKAYGIYRQMGYSEYPPERTEEFIAILANTVTELPIEFFDNLLIKDMSGLIKFINNGILYNKKAGKSKDKIALEYPVEVGGKTVTELDFSGMESMTTATLKKANAKMRQKDIYITQNKELDMRYLLTIAEVLTGCDNLGDISIKDGVEVRNRIANFLILGS